MVQSIARVKNRQSHARSPNHLTKGLITMLKRDQKQNEIVFFGIASETLCPEFQKFTSIKKPLGTRGDQKFKFPLKIDEVFERIPLKYLVKSAHRMLISLYFDCFYCFNMQINKRNDDTSHRQPENTSTM